MTQLLSSCLSLQIYSTPDVPNKTRLRTTYQSQVSDCNIVNLLSMWRKQGLGARGEGRGPKRICLPLAPRPLPLLLHTLWAMPKMPVIAIVGRPNVGKSSLLNALARKLISIVQDMPGVTRDRISTPLWVRDGYVELVDTGGYGFDDAQGLTEHIKHQIELAMSRADLVMFIVDCQDGLTSADE